MESFIIDLKIIALLVTILPQDLTRNISADEGVNGLLSTLPVDSALSAGTNFTVEHHTKTMIQPPHHLLSALSMVPDRVEIFEERLIPHWVTATQH